MSKFNDLVESVLNEAKGFEKKIRITTQVPAITADKKKWHTLKKGTFLYLLDPESKDIKGPDKKLYRNQRLYQTTDGAEYWIDSSDVLMAK
jgi:hypothetical protein